MANIILHNLFRVKNVGSTRTKIFKDLKENDLITLSIELDKAKDQGKSKRMTLFLNDQMTYISALDNAIKCGLELKEIKSQSTILTNRIKELESGVKIVRVSDSDIRAESEIMELKGKIDLNSLTLQVVKEKLKVVRSKLIKEGLTDYAGEIQDIIDTCDLKKYGDNRNE